MTEEICVNCGHIHEWLQAEGGKGITKYYNKCPKEGCSCKKFKAQKGLDKKSKNHTLASGKSSPRGLLPKDTPSAKKRHPKGEDTPEGTQNHTRQVDLNEVLKLVGNTLNFSHSKERLIEKLKTLYSPQVSAESSRCEGNVTNSSGDKPAEKSLSDKTIWGGSNVMGDRLPDTLFVEDVKEAVKRSLKRINNKKRKGAERYSMCEYCIGVACSIIEEEMGDNLI